MKDNAREFIIKNLRQALALNDANKVAPKPPSTASASHFRMVYNDDMVLNFVNKYMLCGGNLNYAVSNTDVANILNAWIRENNISTIACGTSELTQFLQNLDLETRRFAAIGDNSKYGILLCESLVAWDGSIVITSNCFEDKEKIVMPENIVLVAFSSQVVPDLKTCLAQKAKDGQLPLQSQILYPENLDHKRIQMLLVEDQN